MKPFTTALKYIATLALMVGALTGCESDGGSTHVSGGVYYGAGFYDPWYYGPGYYPPGVIVTPPPRPDRPHVEHPIARPAPARPAPSIPSAPRVGGGGRRR